MDIRVLDRKTDVVPILVDLYDANELYNLAGKKDHDARAELIEVITDLFQMELSFSEKEIIADILVELTRQAEKDLRQVLAHTLARNEDVPLRLVLQLANDDIDVAEIILRESPVLADIDLAYIIKSKPAEYWRAIAKRHEMSEMIAHMLVQTGDMDTAVSLVRNEHAHLSKATVKLLAEMARESQRLARPLLRREEISTEIAVSLYKYVGERLKKHIVETYGVSDKKVVQHVEATIDAINDLKQLSYLPDAKMLNDAMRAKHNKKLSVHMMLDTLRRKNLPAFVAQFSKFTGLSVENTIEIIGAKYVNEFASMAKIFGVKKQDFITMCLLTKVMRANGSCVMDVEEMERMARIYDIA